MPELPPLRLCVRNSFFEVVYDEQHLQGEETPACGSVCTVGRLEGSPIAKQSRSEGNSPLGSPRTDAGDAEDRFGAEVGGSPMMSSPQIDRLNTLLSNCAARRNLEADGLPNRFSLERVASMESIVESCQSMSLVSDTASLSTSPTVNTLEKEHKKAQQHEKAPADTRSTSACSASACSTSEYCHKSVPKRLDLRSASEHAPTEQFTTLMLRNVPNCYTQNDLLRELEQLGFGGAFDFAYLPMDKCSRACVGYSFVNFTSPSMARQCLERCQGHRFTQYGKNKEAAVSVAHLQGLAANLAHFERLPSTKKSSKMARQLPFTLTDSCPALYLI